MSRNPSIRSPCSSATVIFVVETGQPRRVPVLHAGQLHLAQRLASVARSIALAARGRWRGVTKLITSPDRPAPARCRANTVPRTTPRVDEDIIVDDIADPVRRRDQGRQHQSPRGCSSLPDQQLVNGVRSRCACATSPLSTATVLSRARSFLAERSPFVLRAHEDDHGVEVLDLEYPRQRIDPFYGFQDTSKVRRFHRPGPTSSSCPRP